MGNQTDKKLKNPEKSDFEVPSNLKDRALGAAAEGITISDALLPDQPIIYVNEGFERLTGYTSSDIIGLNCRFLQGKTTDPDTIRQIKEAIASDSAFSAEILNHRKDGTPFWNRLSITPVKNDSGLTTHFIGIQSDVTKRRAAEAALEMANRSLEEANQKMKNDLEAAALIQQTMLPHSVPNIPGYKFAWSYHPCDELAGDTLDIIKLGEKTIAVYALDVSGHGVPSALLSATLSHWLSPKQDQNTIFESVSGETGRQPVSPELVATRLNRLFPMNPEHPQYFTLFYGLLDIESNEFTYVSAGHPPAIHLGPSSKLERLKSTSPPVGLLEGSRFQQTTIRLKPGDRVYIYTDGITEAANIKGEELGFDRLCKTIRKARNLDLEQSLEDVTRLQETWTDGMTPVDDFSVVAFGRDDL